MPAKNLPKSAEQKRKKNRNAAESVESFGTKHLAVVIMLNPQNYSDEEKWMYLAFRDEMRLLFAWELMYNYYWMDHVLRMMSGSDYETLTIRIEDFEEDRKDEAIDRLIKRQKYDEAFHVATGSSFFCVFDANIMMISFDKRLSLLAAGFFPSMRH
jgi:hypothetical protein